jgi:hypothetical protein
VAVHFINNNKKKQPQTIDLEYELTAAPWSE